MKLLSHPQFKPSSNHIGLADFQKKFSEDSYLLTYSLIYDAVCRTAPATQGVSKIKNFESEKSELQVRSFHQNFKTYLQEL